MRPPRGTAVAHAVGTLLPRSHRTGRTAPHHGAPFVVVTDRLPGSHAGGEAITGITGLPDDPVTSALAATTAWLGGCWVGRPDTYAPTPWRLPLHAIELNPADVSAAADQATRAIWPIYHDLVTPATFDNQWRRGYRRSNAAYAAAVARHAAHGATIWVHDYHLQLVPLLLRRARPDLHVGFYLQAPFPTFDVFRRMPMWRDVLAGLVAADHIGFQAARSAENFLQLIADIDGPLPTVGAYPTAVDSGQAADLSVRADVIGAAHQLRSRLGDPEKIILSINNADEAQGIEQRLRTIEHLFRHGRLKPTETVIVQIVIAEPNADTGVLDRIAQRVARINGDYATVGRPCVHHVVDTPTLADRVALYHAADVLVATPLHESATPCALEFAIAARPQAALVLSEFTGTAATLPDAYLVNPHDLESTADTIVNALAAPERERVRRMRLNRSYPASYDNYAWATHFLLGLHTNELRHESHHEKIMDEPRWPSQPRSPSTFEQRARFNDPSLGVDDLS